MRLTLLLAVLASLPANATEIVRLSDTQREAVMAAAANGPERNLVLTPEQAQRPSVLGRSLYPEFYGEGPAVQDRKVHGEVSMFAGSGGTLGMSGTAAVPIGQTGSAAISVMKGTSRWGGFSGFSMGYSSNDAQNGLLVGNSFGGGFGGFGGPWTMPYGGTSEPARQTRRR